MELSIPHHKTATFEELHRLFTQWANDLGITNLNPFFVGSLFEIPSEPGIPFKEHPGYVFHVTVLQHVPAVSRLIFVFYQNGTVAVSEITENGTSKKTRMDDDWIEGITWAFETALLSLEFIVNNAMRTTRSTRAFLLEIERAQSFASW